MKLNLGCGQNKIKDCVNVDIVGKPDLCANIVNGLPFKDASIKKIYLFHTVEHIPETLHHRLFSEIWRVLEIQGLLIISYPEFMKCAQNYIDNKLGMRDFWKATIYGRQLYPSDYHVSLMDTREFSNYLHEAGFRVLKVASETEDYNTILKVQKIEKQFFSKPELQKVLMNQYEEMHNGHTR